MADLAITATQVLPGTDAQVEHGNAGATLAAGDVLYLDSTTSTYKLAQNDGTAAEGTVRGLALCGSVSGQPVTVGKSGTVTLGAAAAPVEGTVYVLSSTAGKICPAADLTASDRVVVLGVGNATNGIAVKIFNSGIQVTT